MSTLVNQRCLNHASREAVVRCPECRRFFCRECVTEYRGKMICATCVARITVDGEKAASRGGFRWAAFAAAGFFGAWLIFYYLGVMLARIPSDFFE